MDGAEFIEKVIPLVFMNSCKEASDNLHSIDSLSSSINFHCVMNLPGVSLLSTIEFFQTLRFPPMVLPNKIMIFLNSSILVLLKLVLTFETKGN